MQLAVVTHLQTTADLLHSLGFTINMPTSHLTPTQTLPFIGAILDMVHFRTYPQQSVQDIRAMIQMFEPQSWILERLTFRRLGLIASCILLLEHARWHMRALQWDLKSQWAQHQGDPSETIQVSEETAKDLQWWLLDRNWTGGRPLSLPHPELTLVTDASLLVWEGHL